MTPKNQKISIKPKTSPQKRQKSKAPKKVVKVANPNLVNTFTRAIQKPFAPSSFGCRVPDLFSFPTTTYHSHGTHVIQSDASGVGSVLHLPNPLLSLIDIHKVQGAVTGSVASTSCGSLYQTGYYGACVTGVSGSQGTNNLATIYLDYRVVSWGVKLSNLIPELSATGRVFIYIIPCTDEVPGYNALATGTPNSNIIYNITGASSASLDSAAVLNFPTAFELTEQDLLHGDIEIHGTYVSPRYYDFHAAGDYNVFTTGFTTGDNVIANATGNITISSNRDPTRMVGGCMIGVYFEGFPASTKCLNIEYVYHLEGTPVVSTAGSSPIPSMQPAAVIGSTDIV